MIITPKECMGKIVVVRPKNRTEITGFFLPTQLQLKSEEEQETIGLDLYEIIAGQQALLHGQPPEPGAWFLRQGVHYTLLSYEGKSKDLDCFAGSLFYTEKEIMSLQDPRAHRYFHKQKIPDFMQKRYSRN